MHLGSFFGSHLAVSDAISPFSKESKSSANADGEEPAAAVPTSVIATATLDEKSVKKFLRFVIINVVGVTDADGECEHETEVSGGAKASALSPETRMDASIAMVLRWLIIVDDD
jgi:hypothetical protein